jgi:hypothetical protein
MMALVVLLLALLHGAAAQTTAPIERLPNPADMPPPPVLPNPKYNCNVGRGCCDYTCEGADCILGPGSGLFIPNWWLTSAGFESCVTKVAQQYDVTIPCSKALPVWAECGLAKNFACGYGLACVAKSISFAQCLPICGDCIGGLGSTYLGPFFLNNVTSGAQAPSA